MSPRYGSHVDRLAVVILTLLSSSRIVSETVFDSDDDPMYECCVSMVVGIVLSSQFDRINVPKVGKDNAEPKCYKKQQR